MRRVLLTGAGGMLGSAILRLSRDVSPDLELVPITRAECDLEDQQQVQHLFEKEKVDGVIHAAAVVGGIQANIDEPEVFLASNLRINTNVISAARSNGVGEFLFIGSSCMYPKDYRNPLKEEYLLQAPLEATNEGYALSKIVGAKQCEYISQKTNYAYRTIIPSNLYGIGDDFSESKSHLVASVIRKVIEAKNSNQRKINIWGDGLARREFLFADDLAFVCLNAFGNLKDIPVYMNFGAGIDHSVNEYYQIVSDIMGYSGEFCHDLAKPAGMKQKLMDSSLAYALGYKPRTTLVEGLKKTIEHYQKSIAS
ncbi:NAD-dependent epimerase/dehydratase family protein [Pseudovibrio sp. SPO723]|uniref:NAD-dependent epimerase/dehydratase family protein n=1 Tax=Nesiotobacter zosterae TaxID=392721 RepID=UPI0029C48C52|nr:NAD-dependent epimerase/dehydratase family protein [Pseudovibrio sp. SPO723]MDX5593350.1 NAD-dependent epimerase/dehydratase family protein [Pseudovibrio sp. SPO723]